MHDPIDIAFTAFEKLSAEISAYSETIASESDTRLKVIDRVLTEVLGWSHGAIQTSEQAGSGYTDYVLRIGNSCRLVIEAKKDGAAFDLQSRHSGQAYKLNGAVFHGDALAAIEQAVRYLLNEDAQWCEVPDHPQFAGQKGVCRRLSIMRDRLSRPQQK